MKKRGQRGAIVAVLLLGLLIFGGVYFAWTMVTDIFQPVNTDQGKTWSAQGFGYGNGQGADDGVPRPVEQSEIFQSPGRPGGFPVRY